jgi:MFS family permease
LFAAIGQRIGGLRWPFVIGQTLLLAAIVMFAFSRSLALLIIARIIQGLSCGAVFTAGYPLLYDAFGTAQIGQALGYTSMSLSLGFFVGPILGGFIYDAMGFEWVFAPSVLLTGLEVILRLLVIEPIPYKKPLEVLSKQPADCSACEAHDQRAPLLAQPSGLFTQELDTSAVRVLPSRDSGTSYGTMDSDEVSDASTATTTEGPIKVLLRDPRFLTSMASLFMINNFTASFETIIPVYAYEQFGFTSSQTALVFLCITIPMICSPISGYLCDRFGAKGPALAGFVLWGPTMLGMLLIDDQNMPQDVQLRYFLVLLTLFGVGAGLTFAPIYSEVSASVEEMEQKTPGVFGERGAMILAFGLENAAFGLGAMVGPIYAAVLKERFGFGGMSAVLGLLSLLTCIPISLYTGGKSITQRQSAEHERVAA